MIGLFLLPPDDYLLAVAVGSAAAFLLELTPAADQVRLQRGKLRAHRRVVSLTSSTRSRRTSTRPDVRRLGRRIRHHADRDGRVAAVTIATAISLSGGAPQFRKLPEMIQFGGLVALANTSLALLAVVDPVVRPDPPVAAGRCRW